MPPEAIEKAAHWFGEAERAIALHARGMEHQSKGVENCLAVINLALATGNIGREGAGCTMITGQGNGQGGREHGQKCDQLPGQRSISDPAAREHVAKVWGMRPEDIPQAGLSAMEIMEAIHRGEIKALLSICFNPLVSLPDSNYMREALEKLEFFGVVDFFLSETAHHADVVLAGSLQEEEEGVVCSAEGRVLHIQKAVDPPGDAWPDSRIYIELARRLGKGEFFPYTATREIFEELREASRGGPADYSGITYEKIDRQMGVFWPCPAEPARTIPARRGFSRAAGSSIRTARRASWSREWRESGDPVDEDFPIYLTTGRVVSQYLSGTQTRRIGALVDQYPEPRLEIHPRLAATHGIADGDWVTVTSRRSAITLQALVVRTIRPDTVFIPYHWPGGPERQPAHPPHARPAQQDPRVQSLRLPHRWPRRERTAAPARRSGDADVRLRVLSSIPSRCIGCQACVNACAECDTHRGVSMIHVDYLDRPNSIATVPADLHALRRSHLRPGLPGRRHQERRGRRRAVGAQAALHRLLQLRAGLPVRHPEDVRRTRADDEVRHVLRPHLGRQAADVRHGLPQPGAGLRDAGAHRRPSAASSPSTSFQFGARTVTTEGLHDGCRRT